MNLISPSIGEHIIAIILGIVVLAIAIASSREELNDIEFNTENKTEMYYGNGLMLWGMTLVVCVVWYFVRPLPEIGFGLPQFGDNTWLILVTTFVLLYGFDAWNEVRNEKRKTATIERLRENTPFIPENKHEFQHFIMLCISAGFCEEVIFRGFLIQYFMAFTGTEPLGQFIAVALPGVIFAVAHLYQGWKAVAKIMILAIIFGYIFLETQSLWIVIVLHFLVDFISGYMAWKLLAMEK